MISEPGLWSRQVQPLSWCSLPLVPSEPRPPTRWSHDSRFSAFCFLTRCSAEPRCRRCNQSGRRRCLTRRPATDLLSPPRRIWRISKAQMSLVPATCVESHWAENETQFSLCINVWRHLQLVWEHNTLLYTCTYSQTKEPRCMRQCVC